MSLSLVTAPTQQLITVAEFRAHARIDEDVEDNVLLGYLNAATRRAESLMRRQLATATWRLQMNAWDDSRYAHYDPTVSPGLTRLTQFHVLGQLVIELPMSPLISVDSVQYVDMGGTTQTLATSYYSVDTYHEPGRIIQNYGVTLPVHRSQLNAVTVQFQAGYSSLTDPRLDPIKLAVSQIASHWYEHREATSEVQLLPIPMGAENILELERVGGYP